jgi:copper chaperone CopZ
MKTKIRHSHLFGFIIFLLTIGYSTSLYAQTDNEQERIYVKIEIKGMACPYCAFGMEKELKQVAGVDKVEIELKKGLAYISTPLSQKPTMKSLEKIITDSGFTVGKIEYSSEPFTIKESPE